MFEVKVFDVPFSQQSANLSPTVVAPFSCTSTNNIPGVGLFIPDLERLFYECDQNMTLFESSLIVGFIHELDHLALGMLILPGEQTSAARILENEVYAWDRTCANIIRVMLEQGMLMLNVNETRYKTWERYGKCVNPMWWHYISQEYGLTL